MTDNLEPENEVARGYLLLPCIQLLSIYRGGDSYQEVAHVLNVKLWGCGPRLRIIRLHESKLHLVSWGLGKTTIRCRGRAADKLVAV